MTQFSQAVSELGISLSFARSPQAKGRIERLWGTLQDRLTMELRLRQVSTLEEANRVLPELIEKYNARFAVEPAEPESAYRPHPGSYGYGMATPSICSSRVPSPNPKKTSGKTPPVHLPVRPINHLQTILGASSD